MVVLSHLLVVLAYERLTPLLDALHHIFAERSVGLMGANAVTHSVVVGTDLALAAVWPVLDAARPVVDLAVGPDLISDRPKVIVATPRLEVGIPPIRLVAAGCGIIAFTPVVLDPILEPSVTQPQSPRRDVFAHIAEHPACAAAQLIALANKHLIVVIDRRPIFEVNTDRQSAGSTVRAHMVTIPR